MKMSLEDLVGMLLLLAITAIVGFGVAVSIYVDGMCRKSLLMLGSWLAATGILWSIPFIFQRFRRGKKIHVDERGRMIFKNALVAANIVFWFYFLLACFVAWWIVGPAGSVSVNVLPIIFVGGIVIFQFVFVLGNAFLERPGSHHGQ